MHNANIVRGISNVVILLNRKIESSALETILSYENEFYFRGLGDMVLRSPVFGPRFDIIIIIIVIVIIIIFSRDERRCSDETRTNSLVI